MICQPVVHVSREDMTSLSAVCDVHDWQRWRAVRLLHSACGLVRLHVVPHEAVDTCLRNTGGRDEILHAWRAQSLLCVHADELCVTLLAVDDMCEPCTYMLVRNVSRLSRGLDVGFLLNGPSADGRLAVGDTVVSIPLRNWTCVRWRETLVRGGEVARERVRCGKECLEEETCRHRFFVLEGVGLASGRRRVDVNDQRSNGRV